MYKNSFKKNKCNHAMLNCFKYYSKDFKLLLNLLYYFIGSPM